MVIAPHTYLLVSAAVGAAQIVDALALLSRRGRANATALVFAFTEYVWALVSFFAWRGGDMLPGWLPASFLLYVAGSTIAGIVIPLQNPVWLQEWLLQRHDESMAMPPLPAALIVAGFLFGLYFFTAASLLYLSAA